MVENSFPRKQNYTNNFQQNFGFKIFYGYKTSSSKADTYQKFEQNIFVKLFMVAKSFSRKQDTTKIFNKIFWTKMFMVAKSFPRKQIHTKNVYQNLYGCKIISTKKGNYQIFLTKYFGQNCFMVENHFLDNRFARKIFIKRFGQ